MKMKSKKMQANSIGKRFLLGCALASFAMSACEDHKKGSEKSSAILADEGISVQKKPLTIQQGRLVDGNGQDFVLRGVNSPHAYFGRKALEAIPRIKELGFNSVRVVWCADTLERSGRCEGKDMQPLLDRSNSEKPPLADVLAALRANGLVAMLNLQNATGSNDPEHVRLLVDWLVSTEVTGLLKEYEDMLLINIANEWHGEWVTGTDSDDLVNPDALNSFVGTYESAIQRLRDAGLNHVLVIDGAGYAQDFGSIPYIAQKLVNHPNVMFSAHMYDLFNSEVRVAEVFQKVKGDEIPFVVGEFACSHFAHQPTVACEAIMKEASASGYGYMAWSYTGNSGDLAGLDMVNRSDWTTLSKFGRRIVEGEGGIAQTSKQASIFAGISKPSVTKPTSEAQPEACKSEVVSESPTIEMIDGYPVCVHGYDSDPDRDGWGWENQASCRVRESVN